MPEMTLPCCLVVVVGLLLGNLKKNWGGGGGGVLSLGSGDIVRETQSGRSLIRRQSWCKKQQNDRPAFFFLFCGGVGVAWR